MGFISFINCNEGFFLVLFTLGLLCIAYRQYLLSKEQVNISNAQNDIQNSIQQKLLDMTEEKHRIDLSKYQNDYSIKIYRKNAVKEHCYLIHLTITNNLHNDISLTTLEAKQNIRMWESPSYQEATIIKTINENHKSTYDISEKIEKGNKSRKTLSFFCIVDNEEDYASFNIYYETINADKNKKKVSFKFKTDNLKDIDINEEDIK